jgi:hypothetical protein
MLLGESTKSPNDCCENCCINNFILQVINREGNRVIKICFGPEVFINRVWLRNNNCGQKNKCIENLLLPSASIELPHRAKVLLDSDIE